MVVRDSKLSSRSCLNLAVFFLGISIDCLGNSALAMLSPNRVPIQNYSQKLEIPSPVKFPAFKRTYLQPGSNYARQEDSVCNKEPRSCSPGGSR